MQDRSIVATDDVSLYAIGLAIGFVMAVASLLSGGGWGAVTTCGMLLVVTSVVGLLPPRR